MKKQALMELQVVKYNNFILADLMKLLKTALDKIDPASQALPEKVHCIEIVAGSVPRFLAM